MIKPLTKAQANGIVQAIKRIDPKPKGHYTLTLGVRHELIQVMMKDADYGKLLSLAGRKLN